MLKTQEIISTIKKEFSDIQLIYLFGSVGTEFEHPESDVDIAILTTPGEKLSPLKCWNLAQKIAKVVNRNVDLVDLQSTSTVFRFEIIGNGKKIYCKNTDICDAYETRAISEYLFFNEERKEIVEEIKRRGKIYD